MENKPIIITETFDFSPEMVWEAITDKDKMKEWYFEIPDFDLKVGMTFHFYEPGGANKYLHRCIVKEIIPGKKLRHTWEHPNHSSGTSVITWEIEELNNGSKLILTHEGVENFSDGGDEFKRENYEVGWGELIKDSLKNFLRKV